MGSRFRVAFAFVLAGCGIGVVGIGPSADSTTPESDAGSSDASTSLIDGAIAADAAVPDVDEAGCKLLVHDDFTNPDPRWKLQADAVFRADAVALVKPEQQHHGAIVIPVPSDTPITSFSASFTLLMKPEGDADIGDGITLDWASNVDEPPLGGTGGAMGFCPNSNSDDKGPNGAALGLHFLDKTGVAPRESDGANCLPFDEKVHTFTGSQPIAVNVAGTDVKANVAGEPFAFQIKSAVPVRWIGFTASTGGAVAVFSVDDVTIRICP